MAGQRGERAGLYLLAATPPAHLLTQTPYLSLKLGLIYIGFVFLVQVCLVGLIKLGLFKFRLTGPTLITRGLTSPGLFYLV